MASNTPISVPLDDAAGALDPEVPAAKEGKRLSRRQIIARRFLRNKAAVLGAIGFALITLMALLGEYIGPWGYTEVDNTAFLSPPSAEHWFGTTQGGRDVFALVVEGSRKSMLIGVCVALLQTGIAAVIGSSAAYFGGWWERIALWLTDLLLVVPSFLIIAVLSQRAGAAKGSTLLFIVLLAGFGWMLTARVVRSLTLSVKNLDYVSAARFMNVSSPVIIARHIIPNIASLLIIDATVNVAYAVISETTLSYFGFGVQPPDTSLGTLIAEGQRSATTYPWIFLAPAAVLVLMLVCVNFMGDGLRDAIDPSSKSGGKA
ncbi:ABC transporter permease [Actinomyces oricola]|uniref:ABC transporter permease n=1 Tax=Actinomyces oricola TaxID=206043 RepID=UPI000FFEDC01|nr:ABC transporter permease [Actinomyces oricola]